MPRPVNMGANPEAEQPVSEFLPVKAGIYYFAPVRYKYFLSSKGNASISVGLKLVGDEDNPLICGAGPKKGEPIPFAGSVTAFFVLTPDKIGKFNAFTESLGIGKFPADYQFFPEATDEDFDDKERWADMKDPKLDEIIALADAGELYGKVKVKLVDKRKQKWNDKVKEFAAELTAQIESGEKQEHEAFNNEVQAFVVEE